MQRRAFSLVEVMVVVAILGIAGALAAQGIAAQVRGARSSSERTAVALDLRTQKRHASERLNGLKVEVEGQHRLRFLAANVVRGEDGTPSGCTLSSGGGGGGGGVTPSDPSPFAPVATPTVLAEKEYPTINLRVAGNFCLDEVGRPVDADARLIIEADTDGDGVFASDETGAFAYTTAGVLQGSGALSNTKAVSAGTGAVAGETTTMSKNAALRSLSTPETPDANDEEPPIN